MVPGDPAVHWRCVLAISLGIAVMTLSNYRETSFLEVLKIVW